MKIKMDINFKDIDENGEISEELRNDIIETIKNEVSPTIKDIIKKISEPIVKDALIDAINEQLNADFQPCDKWGDAKGERTTLRELIKKEYENVMKEKVDNDGRVTYNANQTRLQYFITKTAKESFTYEFERILKNEALKIREEMQKTIIESLTQYIMGKK